MIKHIGTLKVTSLCYRATDKVATAESPYTAAFTFSGNKIKFVDAVTSAEFVAKHRAF